MIYTMRLGENIFDLNPGLRLVPEFDILTPLQMMFVCLVCDFSKDNPVGTNLGRRKREVAARIAGYKMEDGKRLDKNGRDVVLGHNKRIETAIAKFQEIHFDKRQLN